MDAYDEQALQRLFDKVDVDQNGCWLWTAGRTSGGYGNFLYRGRNRPAHRIAYELLVGPVPPGLELDHLCRVRACCNPEHVEPVTRQVNLLRGETFQAFNARKTHCPQGHPYDKANTRWDTGLADGVRRRCRSCVQTRQRAYRAARKVSVAS